MNFDYDPSKEHYINLDNNYYILVPISKEYVDDLYQYKIYDSKGIRPCFKKMVFNEKKYIFIEKRLFDFINEKCDSYICMYEDEVIENDKLQTVKNITESLIQNSDEDEFLEFANEFLELVKYAIEAKVPVGFCF